MAQRECVHSILHANCCATVDEMTMAYRTRLHTIRSHPEFETDIALNTIFRTVVLAFRAWHGGKYICNREQTLKASVDLQPTTNIATTPMVEDVAPVECGRTAPSDEEHPTRKRRQRSKKTEESRQHIVKQPIGTTLADFPDVAFDDHGTPTQTFEKHTRSSYYQALHDSDPTTYRLGSTIYDGRRTIYEKGLPHYGDKWGWNPLQAIWTYKDGSDQTRIATLIINEAMEVRWGHIFCTGSSTDRRNLEMVEDFERVEIPVFLANMNDKTLRYCGNWRFERCDDRNHKPFMYIEDTRERDAVFRVTPSVWDEFWN